MKKQLLITCFMLALHVTCPLAGDYKGCYKDTSKRDLNGYTFSTSKMTTELCESTCKSKGFRYAATQYGSHCFCDDSFGSYGSSQSCNMRCSGNASETCGGSWANSVYELASFSKPTTKSTTDSKGRVRHLGKGLTQYTIWSSGQDGNGDSSGQTINMGEHTYCALTYVMSGGFQSACSVTVHGDNWILKARDPGSPDPYAAESQGCSAICFDR